MITETKFLLEILFLPGILGIGILSTLSDIKTGKVKNSLIKKGFLYGLIIYSFLVIWTLIRQYAPYDFQLSYLKLDYFPALIINTLIAFTVGIIFWKFDVWAAADAKLFTLYSFLIPLTVYTYERMPYFPSFALLVNIYAIALLYLFFVYLRRIKIGKEDFKKFFSEKIPKFIHEIKISKIFDFLLVSFIAFSITFFIFYLVINKISTLSSLLILIYIAHFAILMQLMQLMQSRRFLDNKKIKVLLLFLVIIFMAIQFVSSINPLLILTQFLRFILYMIVIGSVFKLFGFLAASDIQIINTEDLRQNMILTTDALKLLSENQEFYKNLGDIYPDGLSPEQAEKIKEFFKNKGLKTIGICRTFPFAAFIFAGVIVTLIMGGSLIGWLITIL